MKKKKIAQLCCAALVAAGVGLNIQNALTDYGMCRNSLSLVASPFQELTDQFPVLTDQTMGWCSFVNETHFNPTSNNPEPVILPPSQYSSGTNTNSNTNSNSNITTTIISKIGRVEGCGSSAGIWKLYFESYPSGREDYITGVKQTFLIWRYKKFSDYIPNPDGTQTLKYYWEKTCSEYLGSEGSTCLTRNATATEWID